MPCQFVRTPTGTMIFCGPLSRAKATACWECSRPGVFQCDGPSSTSEGGCNRFLCVQHRTQAGVGVDYCREHAV